MHCVHFGSCGGCTTQGIPYEEELLTKELFIKELFKDLSSSIFPIMACDFPERYRNKMEFSFSQSKEGVQFLGMMMRARRGRVVSLSECYLPGPWFIPSLHAVKRWWEQTQLEAYFPPKDRGHLRTLTLRAGTRTGEAMVILTVSGNSAFSVEPRDLENFVKALTSVRPFDSIILRTQIMAKKTPTYFKEEVLWGRDHIFEEIFQEGKSLTFKIRPSSFFQPNTYQAEKIYKRAIDFLNPTDRECVLDLYCGTGSLGIFASKYAQKVVGIELNESAVEDAKENIRNNLIANMELFCGDVGETTFAEERIERSVIVDPPRAGMSPKALKKILAMSPKKIVYISCNPCTQKENVMECIQDGYSIANIQPVDQFPHTPHIENIVELVRPF